jgi:hypothetical protein
MGPPKVSRGSAISGEAMIPSSGKVLRIDRPSESVGMSGFQEAAVTV